MKVYTHFIKIDENDGYRWRTLLQFGNSWDCIGSVVMKNPGSSKMVDSVPISNDVIIKNLKKYQDIELPWYEFSEDTTMKCIAELFAYKCGLTSPDALSGVIQIFNIFYIKEADLERAKSKDAKYGLPNIFASEQAMSDYDIKHLLPPVYLGFGNLAFDKHYRDRCEGFFNVAIKDFNCLYLSHTYSNNSFYHPLYLMRYGKSTENGIKTLLRFKQNTLSPEGLENAIKDLMEKRAIDNMTEQESNLRWQYIYACLNIFCKNTMSLELLEESKDRTSFYIPDEEGKSDIIISLVNQKGDKSVGVRYSIKNHVKDKIFDAASKKLTEIDKSFTPMLNTNGNVIWIGKLGLTNRLKDTDAFIRETKELIRKVVEELQNII